MNKARVVKSTGSWYLLRNEDGEMLRGRIRGRFRLENIQHTNPVAVGDWVDYELDTDGLAVIVNIHPRHNYIIRRAVKLSRKSHIIASNIDRAFLVITLKNPQTSFGFVDRFLVTAEAYHIPCFLLINKMDIYDKKDLEEVKEFRKLYEDIGYPTMEVSAHTGMNLELLKKELKDITSLISGHSGVGKSTLINKLHPTLELQTAEVSDFNRKGRHTTTFAEMYEWPFGGFCIDTPGIKEFGLVEMEKAEIDGYFPEIFKTKGECHFDNCLHTTEPGCAVVTAVEEGRIAPSRYENYLLFLEEAD